MNYDADEFLGSLVTPTASPTEAWKNAEAIALMSDTDGLVEQLGCRGADPTIQAAVRRVNAAHGKRDMAGVRAACRAIEDRARELVRRG